MHVVLHRRHDDRVPTRVSFGTAHREKGRIRLTLSHIGQTLEPGDSAPPANGASLDTAGQWPLCRAVTSPTENRVSHQEPAPDATGAKLSQASDAVKCQIGFSGIYPPGIYITFR